MSFFVRKVRKSLIKRSASKIQQNAAKVRNEEISSESEVEADYATNEAKLSDDDDENETVHEKRLRLAKDYLVAIAAEEKEKLQSNDEADQSAIALRLQDDVLKTQGRLQRRIADQYRSPPCSHTTSVLRGHKRPVTCVCVSADSTVILSGSRDGSIIKWCCSKLIQLETIKGVAERNRTTQPGHTGSVYCLAVSADNQHLCSGGADRVINVWLLNDLSHVKQFSGHRDVVTGLVFQMGTNQLYSASLDRTVKVWSLDEMGYVESLFGHQDGVLSIDAMTSERALTCGGRDRSLRLWKLIEESQLVFHAHSGCGSIECVAMINEQHFVSGSDDGALCIWSVMRKKPVCVVKDAHSLVDGEAIRKMEQKCWIISVSCVKNTDLIASGSWNGNVKLWKCSENYKSLVHLISIRILGFINSLCFTSDGGALIAAVAQEHKFGRWWRLKEAKNSVVFVKFHNESDVIAPYVINQ